MHWLVCHTRPRCEKKFAALVAAERFEHYLPLVESVRRYGNRSKHFTKPLFPGYVFTRVPSDQKPRLYQQELLARILPIEQEAIFLRQLADVRKIVESGVGLSLHPLLKRGVQVRVTDGPLLGLVGVVDEPSNPKGVIIAVDVLQQGVLARVPARHLQPLV